MRMGFAAVAPVTRYTRVLFDVIAVRGGARLRPRTTSRRRMKPEAVEDASPRSRPSIRRIGRIDAAKLDEAFAYIQEAPSMAVCLSRATDGWYMRNTSAEARREATPNSASIGKSFTSIAVGILIHERPDLFPDGLDKEIFTTRYFPPGAFPLSDPARANIKLGQFLAMTAGIRGNNPGFILGREVTLDPPGPDGWQAMVDEVALDHCSVNSYPTLTASILYFQRKMTGSALISVK